MSACGYLWLKAQSLERHAALRWWTVYYRTFLRLHPAVKRLGRIEVSGRMFWMLDPRGSLELGNGVRIHSGHRFNAVGGHRPTIVNVLAGGRLKIGDRSGLSSSTIVCQVAIEIEADVRIGGGCQIFDSDFHSLDFQQRMMRPDPGVAHKPVRICAGSFIGADSIILKGVTIGTQAVVGAGSLVSNDIPPREVWTGNPASFRRKLE